MSDGNGTPADVTGLTAMQRLLDDKTRVIRRIGTHLKAARQQAKDAVAERDAAVKARDDATAAAEKARTDYDAARLKAELETLRGEVREGKHRAAFGRIAAEKGVPEDALDLVYRTSGYKVEGDEPDEAAIGKLLDGLRDQPGVARLFGGEPSSPPNTTAPPPGSGQGGRDRSGGKFRVTTDQLSDGAWCMKNSEAMNRAIKDGLFEIVESPGR